MCSTIESETSENFETVYSTYLQQVQKMDRKGGGVIFAIERAESRKFLHICLV